MPRQLLSPADDTATRALIDTQTAVTRVKELVSEAVSKGWTEQETTKRLNGAIAAECKKIADGSLREEMRKALVAAARKWHYELKQTFRVLDRNLARKGETVGVDVLDLVSAAPFRKIARFREILDDGHNPGIPLIKDYQKSVRLAVKAMSAEPPKCYRGTDRAIPVRLRAEMAARYAAAVENLQQLIDAGVKFCWISSHPNCSPRCAPYQGRLYSLFRGKATVGGKEYGERGSIDGIPYRPINEALAGTKGDGNGCISGYNCRHRAIEYKPGSKPPADFSEAEIRRAYAIDQKQRSFENRIRQLKTEERQLRAMGMTAEAKSVRRSWKILTNDYKIFSLKNDRAFYPYRCIIDEAEMRVGTENSADILTDEKGSSTIGTDKFAPSVSVAEAEQYAKKFAASVSFAGVKNLDSVNSVNETLTRLTEKYPTKLLDFIGAERMGGANARSNCKSLRIDTSYANSPESGQPWAETLEGCKAWIHYFEQIVANPKIYTKSQIRTAKDKIADYSEMLKCSRFSVSSSLPTERRVSGTITHEYGHILSDQLFGLINGKKANPDFEMNVNNPLYQRQQLLSATFRRARETGDVHKISHYANHDSHEFFAECFAAREFGEDLPDYIQTMLEECLK